jgi:uncharacterized protein
MTMNPATPVPPAERVELLDALRGFALLGILVINLAAFSGWPFISAAHQAALPTAAVDHQVHFLSTLLVEGKFYSLFSLLFGIGFAVQMLRAQERGIDFAPRFRRRLWVLLGIGMVHLCFFWYGDILVLYALLGFLLIPVRRFGDRPLLIAAAALILAPIAVHTAILLSGGVLPGAPLRDLARTVDAHFGFEAEDFPSLLGRIGWVEFFQLNLAGPLYRFATFLDTSRALKVFGMFLIGFVAARRAIFRDVAAHRALLRRVLAWGLALGLAVNVAWAWITLVVSPRSLSWPALAETAGYALGVAPLALAYAAAFALLWQRPRWRRHLQRLAPAGRMALTNYLVQTAFGIGLFYGVGLGLTGKLGPTFVVPLAVVVFVTQVRISALWLRHCRYGPAEWLWRSLTYARRQPMRIRERPPVVVGAAG